MAGKQSEQGSGEELARPPGSAPSRADRDVPAGWAASSRGEHTLFDNENFSIGRRSDPVELVLAGDIDYSSLPHLTAALPDAVDGSGVLHVDLADVYFCDLAALRAIIGLGQHREDQQPWRRPRSVVLHNVPVHVDKVMRIVGWDTTPGLTIDTGGTSAQNQVIRPLSN